MVVFGQKKSSDESSELIFIDMKVPSARMKSVVQIIIIIIIREKSNGCHSIFIIKILTKKKSLNSFKLFRYIRI